MDINKLRDNWVEKKLESLNDRSLENLRIVLKEAFMAGFDTANSLNDENS